MAQGNSKDAATVSVGWVQGLHGTAGEIRVRVYSDVPHRFDQGQTLYCNGHPYTIAASTRSRTNQAILKLHGVDQPATAEGLVGQWLMAPPETSPDLPQGEYFHYQLLGLQVVTEEGEGLGEVTEILPTGSNDVYVVSGDQGEVLIPAISEVILEVDLERGMMVVRLLEGLR